MDIEISLRFFFCKNVWNLESILMVSMTLCNLKDFYQKAYQKPILGFGIAQATT